MGGIFFPDPFHLISDLPSHRWRFIRCCGIKTAFDDIKMDNESSFNLFSQAHSNATRPSRRAVHGTVLRNGVAHLLHRRLAFPALILVPYNAREYNVGGRGEKERGV